MPDDVKAIKEDKFKKKFLDRLYSINENFRIISENFEKETGKKCSLFPPTERLTEELFRNKVLDCLSCMTHNLANITDFLKRNKGIFKKNGP